MGVHMAPRSQNKHSLSTLEAGGCGLSKGFLLWSLCQTVWRAVQGLASPLLLDEKACNMCFLWHSNQPLPSASIPHTPLPPTPSSLSQKGLPVETGGLIFPWSALQLYPSDKALCAPSLSQSGGSLANVSKALIAIFCLMSPIQLRPTSAYLEGQTTCRAPFRVITDDGEKARQVFVKDFFKCFRRAAVKWTIN